MTLQVNQPSAPLSREPRRVGFTSPQDSAGGLFRLRNTSGGLCLALPCPVRLLVGFHAFLAVAAHKVDVGLAPCGQK
jgi:hypothetical protein